jgi:hypothetical protein
LPFSRSERAADALKKGTISREAVGWNGGLAGGFDYDSQLYLVVPGWPRMPARIERS